jgi:hypothetical protein
LAHPAGGIEELQECINRTRLKVWKAQPEDLLEEAFIDVDGTIAGTGGECKGGVGLSYKDIWGYAPLIVSLANTKEVLYLVNRPGNASRNTDSVQWIDRAVDLDEGFRVNQPPDPAQVFPYGIGYVDGEQFACV